mgnify:CR=1 FL=1
MKRKELTQAQKHHREGIVYAFRNLAREKYEKGCLEHGGDLEAKTIHELLLEIRDEAIDTFIYAQTAIDKLQRDA